MARNGTVLAICLLAACDFFQELESAPDAEGETEGETEGPGDTEADDAAGACEVAAHDRCGDQDTLHSCNPQTGELTTVDCGELCGGLENFTCVLSHTGQHACWCVETSDYKVYTCAELEDCIYDCLEPGPCTDTCFSRVDSLTARMYGALVHCAEAGCDALCRDTPEACGACIDQAIFEGGQGCSLERAVCDADRSPDDWP